jgi:hypothetical protein
VKQKLRRLGATIGTLPREITITLVVTLVVTVAAPPLLLLLTKHKVPVWVAVLAFGVALLVGIVFGTTAGGITEDDHLRSEISDLESRANLLGAYQTYAEHVRDALALLRRGLEGELPRISIRDFIEIGVFEPAHKLLLRDHTDAARGDVRFSILRAVGDDFVMADEHGLLPARGHRPESRQESACQSRTPSLGLRSTPAVSSRPTILLTMSDSSPTPKPSQAANTSRWCRCPSGGPARSMACSTSWLPARTHFRRLIEPTSRSSRRSSTSRSI